MTLDATQQLSVKSRVPCFLPRPRLSLQTPLYLFLFHSSSSSLSLLSCENLKRGRNEKVRDAEKETWLLVIYNKNFLFVTRQCGEK